MYFQATSNDFIKSNKHNYIYNDMIPKKNYTKYIYIYIYIYIYVCIYIYIYIYIYMYKVTMHILYTRLW